MLGSWSLISFSNGRAVKWDRLTRFRLDLRYYRLAHSVRTPKTILTRTILPIFVHEMVSTTQFLDYSTNVNAWLSPTMQWKVAGPKVLELMIPPQTGWVV
jgi:hypothetical protein